MTVNETQVAVLDVQGPVAGKAIAIPRAAIKVGQPNRIRFAMEGRGQFGYSAVLSGFTREFGPEQAQAGRIAWVERRTYSPANPELDGKTLPVGFSVAVNPTTFENLASQASLGGRARIMVNVLRNVPSNTPEWQRDFLVVQEHLPAGTTLIEGSVNTQASSYELADGVLTLYFPPSVNPGATTYEVFGTIPGQYRALPATVRSAYEPGRFHLGQPGDFRVRSAGQPGTDPYKPTPDELYARGKVHFDAGRFTAAGEALEPLFGAYALRDDVAKDAARMLLLVSIREGQHAARSSSSSRSSRRNRQSWSSASTSCWRSALPTATSRNTNARNDRSEARPDPKPVTSTTPGSASLLRQPQGQTLESLAYLVNLWRSYPETASIESDFFGLSQVVVQAASKAFTDPMLRREMAVAGITRSQLLLQSIRMTQTFLALSPRDPDGRRGVSLALVGAFIELEDFRAVERLSARFAKLFPKSGYFDSFQYSEALGDFHLGRHDRAIEVAQAIARATYKDAAGADQPSPNKWQAIYILGQIYDARRQPARALEYYKQVADRFTDAAGAIQSYTRKDLKVPEVTVVRPEQRPAVAAQPPAGFRAVPATGPPEPASERRPSKAFDRRRVP